MSVLVQEVSDSSANLPNKIEIEHVKQQASLEEAKNQPPKNEIKGPRLNECISRLKMVGLSEK